MTAAVPDVLQQDLIDIKTLLLALNHLLQEDGTSNASCADNSQESLESLELLSVATVIDKLSLAATKVGEEDEAEMVSLTGDTDVRDKAVRQTVEENEDLKRQNILLEQQLEEKERRIRVLERLLLSEGKSYRSISDGKTFSVNTATQTDRLPRTSSLDRTKIGSSISFRAKGLRIEEPRKPPIQSTPSIKTAAGIRTSSSANLASLKEKLQLARSEAGKRYPADSSRIPSSPSSASSSSSSSTSYLASPLTPRRKFLLASTEQERTKSVSSLCSSNYNSSSGSSSYLLSPRPVRSRLSGESQGVGDCRHGWLYTQSQYKYNNRAFKPTIL